MLPCTYSSHLKADVELLFLQSQYILKTKDFLCLKVLYFENILKLGKC